MEEAIADSGSEESSIDMNAAMEEITDSIFDSKPIVATEENDDTAEGLAGSPPEEPEEEVIESKEETPEVKAAPQSWKKEMHESWSSLDPAVQDYIEQRENQMKEGLEKDRGDANLGRVMRDVMSPYSEMLKTQGIDESVMVRNLMNAHYRITTADDNGRRDLINQLAQSYGIDLNGEPQKVDPALKTIQDKVNQLESHLTTSHQQALQAARERVQSDVEAFAADPKHEFFDEVAEQIIPLINAGYELEDAYKNAIWLNPVTRQKEIDRTSSEAAAKAQELAKQEAEKARKAKSTNVRGRDTGKTPTEPHGTMEDTMRETLREIKNRST